MNSHDHDKWEHDRLVTSGALKIKDNSEIELENMEESEQTRVMLLVHDLKPPFLDGRENFTKQTKPVQVVRDPTSDFAVLAKKGSSVLKFVRDRKERSAMREKFWDIQGSHMGNIINQTAGKKD
jgi:pre-mRNA-splicing factor ATP-dependent RNA helicase DHX38/PRP16